MLKRNFLFARIAHGEARRLTSHQMLRRNFLYFHLSMVCLEGSAGQARSEDENLDDQGQQTKAEPGPAPGGRNGMFWSG
jgi:hypothetical protein